MPENEVETVEAPVEETAAPVEEAAPAVEEAPAEAGWPPPAPTEEAAA